MVTVIVHQRGAYMNIDGGVTSVDPPPCLGRTNLPADKQSRRTSIETMLTIVRRSISSNILETSPSKHFGFCLAFCSKQKGPQVPLCRSPIAGARCSRSKSLSYCDLWAASRSLDSEGDAGGSLSETQVLVTIEDKTYLFFSQSWFLSSARSSIVARQSTFPRSLCFKPCSVPKSSCQVAETTERVLNRMLESVIRVSRLPAVFVKDVCVGESRVVIEYGDGKRRRNVGNVGAANQQTTRPCTAATLESQSERIILNNNIYSVQKVTE